MNSGDREPTRIAGDAIRILNKKITNEIFLIIQNNPKLMHRYLRAVEERGLDTVNKTIGKKIKKAYNLANVNQREKNPLCTLIKSHQKFD